MSPRVRSSYTRQYVYPPLVGSQHVATDEKLEYSAFAGGYFEPGKGAQYYVPDWQGNNVGVVDKSGKLIETTTYYPYGEPTKEPTGQRFLYGGKEREHGGGRNSYDFSARCLIAPLGQWGVPDPQAEKYFSYSPYSYCAGDPINRIDPDGCDWYLLGLDGKIKLIIPNESDALLIQNSEGRIVTSSEYALGTLNIETATASNGIDNITTISLVGDDIGTEIFETLASNTNVEWSLIQADDLSNGIKEQNYIGTSHNPSHSYSIGYHMRTFINSSTHDVFNIIHSHPSNNPVPSGIKSGKGDIWNAKKYSSLYPHALFSIFIPNTRKYIYYTANSKEGDFSCDGGALQGITVFPK